MQNLARLINDARKKAGANDQLILNLIREYLQVLILKAVYLSRYGKCLSFMGGTCLRICYDLKRFSEDLDFALDRNANQFDFKDLHEIIRSFLKNSDFEVEISLTGDKTVQKSYIKISKVLHVFGLSSLKEQKLHVKLEVDTKPVKVTKNDIETFFVRKFDEIFPILKHNNETLLAGKILAILKRPYDKGRDYYDLLWYLNRKTDINLKYLNKGLGKKNQNIKEVFKELDLKIKKLDTGAILKDIQPFMEDKNDEIWMRDYYNVFKQAIEEYKKI